MLPLRALGLLMLVFSLCDADSWCTTEHNPLILDPPEVLAEYGEPVSLNCSSGVMEEYHDGMYWRVGNKDYPEQYDRYILWSGPLSDWNVTAECKIRMNLTECSKGLEITLYQNPQAVNVFPTKHTAALEGTLYELQCDIIDIAPVQNLTVKWYRDDQVIRTDSFTNTTRRIVSESSILVVNVSRGENGAEYKCEAQLDFGSHGPQLPVTSDPHIVSVHYAPELKNTTEDVHVYEGDSVTLSCEAEGRPPPVFVWTHDGVDLMERTNQLNITGATNTTYECIANNNLGAVTKQIHVHVIKPTTAAAAAPAAITTPEPSTPRRCPLVMTPAKVVVRFGDPVSVNCSTPAADFSKIGWEVSAGGKSIEDFPVVTWIVERVEDWAIKPLCFVNLKENFQCDMMLDITLYQTPDIVSVSALDQGPMVEGTEHRLICDVTNVAPLQNLSLTWYHGNETVHIQTFSRTSVTPVNVSSTLRVTPERDHNGALFRCEAELHLGPNGPEHVPTVTSAPYMAIVHYKPLIKACPDRYAGVEHEFSIDMLPCEADGNPPPTVLWYYEDGLINVSNPLTRTQSGVYTAEIENSLGNSNVSVLITVEYGPSYSCDDHYEVVEGSALQCEPDGVPKPAITWFKDGKKMDSPPRWTRDHSGEYSLEATNKHGNATHVLHVNVLYAPVFTQESDKKEVTYGENVTFDCSAEGNPPPKIHWKYNTSAGNVRVTTRGRQQSITVTGATSTNAGVYSCVATNKVGNVTRSVTLIMKDHPKPRAAHLSVIWWLLILLLVALMLILLIVVHRWKKHGRYSLVPVRANDGPDMPMSPMSNGVQA